MTTTNGSTPEPGRPIVLRRGTVLTMNDAHDVLYDSDVLVVGERIEAVGQVLEVPLPDEGRRLGPGGRLVAQRRQGRGPVHGGDPAEEPQLLRLRGESAVGERLLERAVPL